MSTYCHSLICAMLLLNFVYRTPIPVPLGRRTFQNPASQQRRASLNQDRTRVNVPHLHHSVCSVFLGFVPTAHQTSLKPCWLASLIVLQHSALLSNVLLVPKIRFKISITFEFVKGENPLGINEFPVMSELCPFFPLN